jgi:DNA primase large subunit
MASLSIPKEELRFALHYPFTSAARNIVRQANITLEELDESVKERATERVRAALAGKAYLLHNIEAFESLMLKEVLAYPVAKIIVSLMNSPRALQLFAESTGNTALGYLKREKQKQQVLERLAKELSIKLEFELQGSYAKLTVQEFLKHADDSMSLVTQEIDGGNVLLSEEGTARFICTAAKQKILNELPVDTTGVPDEFERTAKELIKEAFYTQVSQHTRSRIPNLGKLKPELFPPCMDALYRQLLAGENLPHLARFDLATFLHEIGMEKEAIIEAFSNAPNYNEAITRYQVERLADKGGRGYRAPSCAKIKEHGFCIADCKVRSPTHYYRKQFLTARRSTGRQS